MSEEEEVEWLPWSPDMGMPVPPTTWCMVKSASAQSEKWYLAARFSWLSDTFKDKITHYAVKNPYIKIEPSNDYLIDAMLELKP